MLPLRAVGASAFLSIARPPGHVARVTATMTAEADRVDALTAQLDTSMRVEQQVNALLARLEATSSRLNTFVLPAEPAADETPPGVAAAAGQRHRFAPGAVAQVRACGW